jgi:Mg-chelatase subunit ChlI
MVEVLLACTYVRLAVNTREARSRGALLADRCRICERLRWHCRAAKALVALEGRNAVTQDDLERVISSCLNHRCAAHALAHGWVA